MTGSEPTDTADEQAGDDLTAARRDFLKGVGAAAAVGASGVGVADQLGEMNALEVVDDPIGSYQYRDWEDLYREEWDWDDKARSTHSVNCTGSCSWQVYTRNGQVWREEQAGDYPRFDDSVPDPNPRGCQKGACFSDYVNADQRVTHPLRRVGERGEGKWKRVSWDEALTEIAEEVVDTVQAEEYDAISGFTPIPAMSPVSFASGSRLINLLGGVSHSFYDWYSDLPPGQPITWGTQTENAESADWYNADYIIAWGSNINVTRIPDAKYFLEAGYDGAKRVGIFTDYSQTAIHCDEWIGPEPGSDTALALGMARTIVDEGLYDEEHLKEQTDMPLLVREDTGKFLRASEVPGLDADADRPEKVFVMVDADGDLRTAPGSLGERDGQHDDSVSIELDFDYFNQAKGNIAVEEELWPKLDLVVDINFRMDSTALNSDIVLPTASHYEKHDLSVTDMHTYVHPFTPAVEPLGESKTDWQIFRELAAKIQEVAEERGVEPVEDRKFDREIDLQSVHDDYTRDWLDDEPGALAEDKAAAEFILEHSEESNPEGSDRDSTPRRRSRPTRARCRREPSG
ncbi:molybdopterin-dependent oxidoreductase [Halobaculum sp. WSA2]|uniref:Molybdopterin-dependent oxidoreductase n=1 Tax=Halobaculum saliterrae TaxID=2073113 RepID=A0A6B0SVS0_9EURY|nr:molybdopterin-dependent oxidoreductase [Halobaculum saliterrae]MXR40322.1 molybdopterin-dependent oxidoreductase [Halobaculum saliterrae]